VPSWTRRKLLSVTTSAGVAGLAGCADGLSGGHEFSDLPATGTIDSELQAFDETVREFMIERDIPGGVLGVAENGEVLAERGYGYRDESLSKEMVSETYLRIASLSKAFTRAAIHTLRRREELSLDDSAFDYLDLEPLPGESYNGELDAITVGHLLRHRGGWDREQSDDPVFTQLDIALERGWDEPPDGRQLVRYMLSEPLQFEPGAGHGYSNLGYIVLGLVIEAVSGMAYQQFLDEEVLAPLGIEDVEIGRSLPTDRPDRETWYFDERLCRNVVDANPLELVRCPDGGYYHEPTAASGGHVVTARAFLRFMQEYWLNGHERHGEEQMTWRYTGTLPGTFSVAIQHRGVDSIVIFNERGYNPNHGAIEERLVEQINRYAR